MRRRRQSCFRAREKTPHRLIDTPSPTPKEGGKGGGWIELTRLRRAKSLVANLSLCCRHLSSTTLGVSLVSVQPGDNSRSEMDGKKDCFREQDIDTWRRKTPRRFTSARVTLAQQHVVSFVPGSSPT